MSKKYRLNVDLYQYSAGSVAEEIGPASWKLAGDFLNKRVGGPRNYELAKLLDFMRDNKLTTLLEPIK